MWVALCHPTDGAAHWAVVGLRQRGIAPIEAITPEALVYSRSFVHAIHDGRPSTSFTLPDGRRIDLAGVRGVLNRVTGVPVDHTAGAPPVDREYAAQEMHAVILSVLYGLPGAVLNPPSPRGLAGPIRPELEWAALAAAAGLRVAVRRDTTDPAAGAGTPTGTTRRIVVLDGRTHGAAAAPDVAAACVALARLAGVRLLGIELTESPAGDWWFRSASPMPDLRVGGDALLDDLADAFRGAPI